MKVLLLNPPAAGGVKMVREGRCMQREGAWTSVWAPISLATMAAVLERAGFEVELKDCTVENIDFTALKKIIKDFKPAIIVFNTATGSIKADLSVASLGKKVEPKIKTAAFGIHVTALPDDCFKMQPALDFIIRGEPEETALDLIQTLKTGGQISKIKGISWNNRTKVVRNPDRPPTQDLDSLPFPAWEKINPTNYRMPVTAEPFLLVGTGRGCPYSCLFCADKAYYGQKLRLPSVKRVVDELEHNQKKFVVESFLFWSESFTLNKDFAMNVCDEIIRRKLKIRFVVNSRVDHLDKQLASKLKKAGCWQIGFGIESANDQILAVMKKGIRVVQIKKAVEMAKMAGLLVTGHFMLGYPGETRQTILATIKLACDLPFDFAQFYCAVPFPGSDFYQISKSKGWIKNNNWSFFEQNFSVLDLPKLSAEEIMNLRQLAYRKFYFRPKIIFNTLSKIRSPRYFLKAISGFWNWIA